MAGRAYAVYIGAGDYLTGVPARDMTREEWEELTAEQRETALRLDLYQLEPDDAPAPPPSPEPEADQSNQPVGFVQRRRDE